jgi:hypothetical protein
VGIESGEEVKPKLLNPSHLVWMARGVEERRKYDEEIGKKTSKEG